MKPHFLQLALLCMWLTACGDGGGHTESTDGLRSLMIELTEKAEGDAAAAEKLAQSVIFRDDGAPWYKEHYGEVKGVMLASEYAQTGMTGAADLVNLVKAQKAKGKTQFLVEKFSDAKDSNAVGFQQTALETAKKPVVLYSVRIVEPGKQSGQHLYNFVYDGGWKFAGTMWSLKPDALKDEKMIAVAGLRAKDREKFFETGELPD